MQRVLGLLGLQNPDRQPDMAYDLKSEGDVKEYLHNLGVEYRFGCYSEKKAEVCHLLGDYLEAIKKDFEKAGRVYKNNCDEHGFGRSCFKYGNYLLVGRGRTKPDYGQALRYFDKGCEMKDADCCSNQGLMLVANNPLLGVQKDVSKGMELLEKACTGDNAYACYYLAGMYISGVGANGAAGDKTSDRFQVQRDMEKAYAYTVRGCNLGNMYSCANLSQMYSKGEGTEKNAQLADKYKKMAKDMEDELLNQKQTLTFQQGLDP